MEKGKKYIADSVFWVEVDRIQPNPYQPRKEFEPGPLKDLSDSIRQYGVLQPLVVTRKETEDPIRGIRVEYELIAGERRLRASKMAGVQTVPVIIRHPELHDQYKLELAIIENLQREDINSVERARAFEQLIQKFNMTHVQVANKVGRSREYVSNTIRILLLPQEMQDALVARKISEGHTRPLLMLSERPSEQKVLFLEIMDRKVSVRDAEKIARRIAIERARKDDLTAEVVDMERQLSERFGTRVRIEKKDSGGKITIDYFTPEDLDALLRRLGQESNKQLTLPTDPLAEIAPDPISLSDEPEDEDLYNVKNFSL